MSNFCLNIHTQSSPIITDRVNSPLLSLAGWGLLMGPDRLPFGAKDLSEGSAKAAVTQWVQERVDGRIEPEKPERNFVPVMFYTCAATDCSDDHEQGVWSPAHAENTHYYCQRFCNLLVPRETQMLPISPGCL